MRQQPDLPLRRPPPARRTRLAPVLLASAAALSGLAAYNIRRARRAERQHPPMGKLLQIDGALVHYVVAGQGRPAAMIPGAGSMVPELVLSLMGPASRRWRTYVFDRPGQGYSTRPPQYDWTPRRQAALLARALRRLQVERPVVVAHSWGCLVALALALDQPDVVGGLVLVSGYYYPRYDLREASSGIFGLPLLSQLLAYAVSPLAVRLAARRIAAANFAPNPVPLSFAAGFPRELVERPSHLHASGRDLAMLRACTAEMQPLYRFVRQPVAIVAGTADRVVDPRRQSMRLASEIPHSSLRLLSGLGHMVHHIRPDVVLSAMEEVWARTKGASAYG